MTKYHTVIRRHNDLFGQTGYQAAAVETCGSLHFLPLITSSFISHHEKSSFMNQLDGGVFGFDKGKGTLPDDPTEDSMSPSNPYQAYLIASMVKGDFQYVSVGLVFKPASIIAGHISKCKTILNSFFTSCGDLPDVAAREVYLLRKCQGVGPLSCPLPTWACLDLLTSNPGVGEPRVKPANPTVPLFHHSRLTLRLLTPSEHYLIGTREVANIFIPLEFNKVGDYWWRVSMSWHNGMCSWVQLVSEHVLSHHSEIFEKLSHTTMSAAPHSLIETVALPSHESFSRISSLASIAHVVTL